MLNTWPIIREKINELVGANAEKILFAAEFAENVSGGLLRYSLQGEKKIRCSDNLSDILNTIAKIWESEQSNGKERWTGFLYFRDGSKEKINYSKHDYYEDFFLDQEFDWEEKYFSGYTFVR